MKQPWDIAIIGGGAGGLFAAVTAANIAPDKRIILLEKEQRVGKKLLTTGNGRCNLSNRSGLEHRYFGDTRFAASAFDLHGVDETCRQMENIGIHVIAMEEGKLFPRSLQAGSVVDMLRYAVEDAGVTVACETSVQRLSPGKPYVIYTNQGTISARCVLVATGGKSCVGKSVGSTGYDILTDLGYRVTKLTPAIVQLTTEKEPIKPLAGIKVDGVVTAVAGKEQRQESGEILFTEYGLSGPPILQVSGMIARHGEGTVMLDLMPDRSICQIETDVRNRRRRFAHRTCEELLTGYMNKRLGQTLLKRAGVEKLSQLCQDITDEEIHVLAETIKSFTLKVTGTKGWNSAQVTCGGVSTDDFDFATMESKRHKGLYVAGELYNVTGDCGGFNLQWAWTSGYLAGKAMGEAIK